MMTEHFNLDDDKELLEKIVAYDELKTQEKELKETIDKINKELKTYMNNKNISKAKNQIYSVILSHIKTKRLSEKKLIEELKARDLYHIYESCLYNSEYDQLKVSRRKGGENIF